MVTNPDCGSDEDVVKALKPPLERVGGPTLVSGLQRPAAAVDSLPSQDTRWQSQLRPDLRRAAPEIYLNFRAEEP